MIDIVPAILTGNEEEFVKKLRQLETFAKTIQVDFGDGQFVDTTTITPEVVQRANPVVPIEAHLMVQNPEEWIAKAARIPATRLIVHIETLENPDNAIAQMNVHGKEIGIALNPDTSVERVMPYLEDIDLVLFMTVVPGKQGNPFQPQVLPMIKLLREQNGEVMIEADGGISSQNILQLVEAGVDSVVVGSGILANEDLSPEDAYKKLVSISEQYQRHP